MCSSNHFCLLATDTGLVSAVTMREAMVELYISTMRGKSCCVASRNFN
ncbi:hypothetical protein SPHINGO8BC_140082 [Sphingobacterium multivorum]|uniref:Uncharacterized protein n=1 Tax=Sphingobacterium multivorum TaxID=28454 RepID=A0A653Z8J1_SPHMU|nr:hypothetical protein SPHINGO8BC_140082 [Sphingobacterium multivorum]